MNGSLLLLFLYLSFVPIVFSFTLKTDWIGCISHHEAKEFLKYPKKNWDSFVSESIDLGLSKSNVYLSSKGISRGSTSPVLATWKDIEKIVKKGKGCHALYEDGREPSKISTFSEKTNLAASLCPPLEKSGAPTLILGGFTMHRISGDGMDPQVDTQNKISCVPIRSGDQVLDTCMGLGYTAIAAARLVGAQGRVTTVEYDPASLEMASFNPWSKQLFDDSMPIQIITDEVSGVLSTVPDSSFNVVIHDPPSILLCRHDLYALPFYRSLFRVLKKTDGRLFHYIGSADSRDSGRLYKGVTERLKEAGFRNIVLQKKGYGLSATT
jgi:predicted methyltransferase